MPNVAIASIAAWGSQLLRKGLRRVGRTGAHQRLLVLGQHAVMVHVDRGADERTALPDELSAVGHRSNFLSIPAIRQLGKDVMV